MVNIRRFFFSLLICLCMTVCYFSVQAKNKTITAGNGDEIRFSYDNAERTVYVGTPEDVFEIDLVSGDASLFKVKYAVSDKNIAQISKNMLTGKKAGKVTVVAKIFYDNEPVWRGSKDCTILGTLTGKRMLCLGDSLMYGHKISPTYAWPQLLHDAFNMGKVYNKAKNGLCIAGTANSGSSLLRQINEKVIGKIENIDIIVIEGGANDSRASVTIGDPTSEKKTTFCGGLNTAITLLQTAYPNAKIYCMTNYCRAPLDRTNDVNATAYDYVTAMEKICALRDIPCFNNYFDSGLNLMDPKCYVWADEGYVLNGKQNYHLSKEAYEYLMPIYADFLIRN